MIVISDQRKVGNRELFTVDIDGTFIKDVCVMDGQKDPWIAGPSTSFVGKDGTKKWTNLVSFSHAHQHEIMEILSGAKLPEIDVDKVDLDEPPF